MVIKQSYIITIMFLASVLLAACGGGSDGGNSSSPPPPPPPPKTTLTETEASAFLNRSTFGATRQSIDALVNSNLEDWFTQQQNATPSLLLPYIQSLVDVENINPRHRVEGWWVNVVHGDDQLRQRVAFALSEIFVTSDRNGFLFNRQHAMSNYYDMLVTNAFGNYRDVLEQVTLSPVMGIYLSILGNQKPDPVNNIRPDENYAREVMQLFSIGLVELNLDGSIRTDGAGLPIDTYDQDRIEAFAHIFTGWTFADSLSFDRPSFKMLQPMEAWEDYHDKGEKILLNDVVVPAGQTASDDLTMALDNLFEHENVGPFISHKLIQRLVTSNPSPAYIERVATIFNDNGQGVRGDLGAVVVAILVDDEAMNGHINSPETFGKLREPLIRNAHLWRAFNAATTSGTLPFGWPDFVYGQSPQRAPHVFNFFEPAFTPPGEISNAGLVAPEFEIATSNNITGMHNAIIYFTLGSLETSTDPRPDEILLDLDSLISIANDHPALVDELDMVFTAGQMTDAMKTEIVDYIGQYNSTGLERLKVLEAAYLTLTSNEYAIQK